MALFVTQSSLTSDDGLSSTQATSDLVVPTNIQDPIDFRSTRNEPQKDQPQIPIYYLGLDWDRIASGFGPCPDGKGSSTSWIWNHGWRVQELGKPRTYHFLCKVCFHKKGPGISLKGVSMGLVVLQNTLSAPTTLIRLVFLKRDQS